jgi:hypothetical protein
MRYRNLSAAGCAVLAFVAALGATAFGQANLPAESESSSGRVIAEND